MFEVPVLSLLLGGLLLLIGILGGGFEIRELKVPKVGQLPRVISALGGVLLISVGMSAEPREMTPPVSTATPSPNALPATPVPLSQATPDLGGFERVTSLSAAEAAAVDQYRETVLVQLRQVGQRFDQEGFDLHASDLGALSQGEMESFDIQLEPGLQYAFVAFCDQDCRDLDLDLKDAGGSQIDADFLEDDYPMVEALPAFEGSYRVTVHMAHCSRGPCRFGVAAFQRN